MSALTARSLNAEARKLAHNFVVNSDLIRKENDLTITGYAEATGLARSTVYRMEQFRKKRGRGRVYQPKLQTILKVSEATGLSVNNLVEGLL